LIWRRKLDRIRSLANSALTFREAPLPSQRSFAEIPFGIDSDGDAISSEVRARLPWDPYQPVVIPGTTISIGGSIDRLDLAGHAARVTDYKSGRPPGKNKQLLLRGGSELQRCLYAYAVQTLVGVEGVEARLLYPAGEDAALYPLPDPGQVLERLAEIVGAAHRHAIAGNLLPGVGAEDDFNDLAFALPGGAKEAYIELKSGLVRERLAGLAPLWEMD
jgi:hypothetical protein